MRTIELKPADSYSTEHYGILFESVARYPMTGAGLHNRHHDHIVKLWENRERDGQLIDPHGRPTTDSHSVTTSAQAIVITAHPAMRNEQPRGEALAIGEVVQLTVNGYPIGEYRIEAGRLSDPDLVKVG